MKKIILSVGCILSLCICLTGCGNKNAEEPTDLKITSNTTRIPYVIGKNMWNGTIYDREDTFKMYTKENEEFLYVQLGDKIEIEFLDSTPDKIQLQDYILDNNGNARYTDKEIQTIDVTLEGNKVEFKLPSNYASLLSSHSTDYEKGACIRGFRLTCSWGENECEYAFIIRTDAG